MIPHAPPMRFDVDGDTVVLPHEHPLCRDGRYTAMALLELGAQWVGRAVQAEPGHAGMLVEVGEARLGADVPAGATVRATVEPGRVLGGLHRMRVVLRVGDEVVVDAGLTLRIA